MVVITRVRANHNAAVLDTALILGCAIFRNSGADHRANQSTGYAACASSGESRSNGPCDDKAESRNGNARSDGQERSKGGTNAHADPATLARWDAAGQRGARRHRAGVGRGDGAGAPAVHGARRVGAERGVVAKCDAAGQRG